METALRTYQLGYAALGNRKVEPVKVVSPNPVVKMPTITPASPVLNTTPSYTAPKQNWAQRNNITFETVTDGLNKLSFTAGNLYNLIKGNPTQVVYMTNPETGERREMSQEQKQQMVRAYETGGEAGGNQMMMQMMQMMMMNQMNQNHQNIPNPQPKDNTALYIGIGAGILVLGGIILVATKK